MKAFIIIQNFLTALVIPIFAAIIGITAIPALALFDYGYQISTSNTENYLLELMGIGVSLGLFVMAWGISLVIFSGFMAGLLRPRLAPGKYPQNVHPDFHHQTQPLVLRITVAAVQGVPSGKFSGVL